MEAAEVVNATKAKLGEKDALALAAQVEHLYSAKGKKVVHLQIKKDKPDDATIIGLMIGPTGNLRAPTLRVGKNLVVGFHEETYAEVFG